MMSLLPWSISIFVTLTSVSVTLASFALQPATVHPSRPDTCFNKDTNSFYEDGDSWQLSGCAMASCMKIGQPSGKSQMMISYEGCGSVGYEPPCYIEEDKQAEFPDCCPQITCPDSSENKDYNSMEEVNNELDTDGRKNETVKTESLMEKQPAHNDYYEDVSQNKARQWRNVNSGVWLQSIESDDDLDSSSPDFQNNQVEQEQELTRKVSPKFWYWF